MEPTDFSVIYSHGICINKEMFRDIDAGQFIIMQSGSSSERESKEVEKSGVCRSM